MTTLSQLVDQIVQESGRPDLLNEIVRYTNQTIREAHAHPERNTPLAFPANRMETVLTATGESLTWEIPDSRVFQVVEAIRYDSVLDVMGRPAWPQLRGPSARINDLTQFFYRSGNVFVFAGFGGPGAKVSVSWFEYPPSLPYYAVGVRPASYDELTGWSYLDGINTPELQAAARTLTTNWLLERWTHCIAEGVRAKVYKRLSDDSRARTSYSLYQSLRMALAANEYQEAI